MVYYEQMLLVVNLIFILIAVAYCLTRKSLQQFKLLVLTTIIAYILAAFFPYLLALMSILQIVILYFVLIVFMALAVPEIISLGVTAVPEIHYQEDSLINESRLEMAAGAAQGQQDDYVMQINQAEQTAEDIDLPKPVSEIALTETFTQTEPIDVDEVQQPVKTVDVPMTETLIQTEPVDAGEVQQPITVIDEPVTEISVRTEPVDIEITQQPVVAVDEPVTETLVRSEPVDIDEVQQPVIAAEIPVTEHQSELTDAEPAADRLPAERKVLDLNQLLNDGFDAKLKGDFTGAISYFEQILANDPSPELAALVKTDIDVMQRKIATSDGNSFNN